MVRMIRCEWLKMRHTPLILLHLWIPVLAEAVFLIYFRYASWEPEQEVYAYIEAVGVAYPFLSALICCLSVELEEAGHYQLFFLGWQGKWKVLAGKCLSLLLLSFGAAVLAVAGFGLFYGSLTGERPFETAVYFFLVLTLWGGQIPVYFLHLLLSVWPGRSVCMITGVGETVLAALFLTGMGDGRWMFFPCAFSGRWSVYLLSYRKTGMAATEELVISIGAMLLIIGAVFVWFHFYEGRSGSD